MRWNLMFYNYNYLIQTLKIYEEYWNQKDIYFILCKNDSKYDITFIEDKI